MLQKPGREEEEVDVRRLGSAAAVGNRPGFDGLETPIAVSVGFQAAEAVEVRVGVAGLRVEGVCVAALRVGLPQLDHRIAGSGRAVAIYHAEGDSDALATGAFARQRAQIAVGGKCVVEEWADGLRGARNEAHFTVSSKGVARRPRKTISKR